MKNIFLITKREYLTQVKKKSFIILTVLAPLLMIGFGSFIGFMFQQNKTQFTIHVVDKSGLFHGRLSSNDQVRYIDVSSDSQAKILSALKEMKGNDGVLLFPEFREKNFDELEKNSQLVLNSKIGMDTKKEIVADISEIIRLEKIKEMNLKESDISSLDKKIDLKTKHINNEKQGDSDLDFGVKYVLGIALMYATFMFIIIYGVRVMRSVLEEKNNRVVEIIISSVKPFELMMGKILGVTFVALTQFMVWITMAIFGALFLNTGFSSIKSVPQSEDMLDKLNVPEMASEISHILLNLNFPLIIFVFLFFFLFGYIFYSSMYAAIGSAVDNETETQQFTFLAIIPLMIGMYGSFTIINNPDGPLGFWLSIIPFTSPVAMVARIPFGVPVWQILLSMALLIASCLLMVFIAGKIYRVGILMYGNKASYKEIWKWIRS